MDRLEVTTGPPYPEDSPRELLLERLFRPAPEIKDQLGGRPLLFFSLSYYPLIITPWGALPYS